MNWSIEPVTSPGGVNGIARYRHRRVAPFITGEFTTYFDTAANQDDSWFDERDNRTVKRLGIQINNGPGATVYIALPEIQITNVQKADSEGLMGLTVSFKALEDSNGTDALTRSPIRIHTL